MPAARDNQNKPMLSFILQFPTAIAALARVKELGAIKYGRDNWKKGGKEDWEYLDALMRHLKDLVNGETFAGDTGCTHLGHIMWNIMALQDLNYPGITYDPELFEAMKEYWTLRRAAEKEGETFMSVEEFMEGRSKTQYLKLRQEAYDIGFKEFPSFEEWSANRQASLDAADHGDVVSTEELLEDIAERRTDGSGGIKARYENGMGSMLLPVPNNQTEEEPTHSATTFEFKEPLEFGEGQSLILDYDKRTASVVDKGETISSTQLVKEGSDEPINFPAPLDMTNIKGKWLQGPYEGTEGTGVEVVDSIKATAIDDAVEELSKVMGTDKDNARSALKAAENDYSNKGYMIGKTGQPVKELMAEAQEAIEHHTRERAAGIAELDALINHPSHKRFIKQKQDEAFINGRNQGIEAGKQEALKALSLAVNGIDEDVIYDTPVEDYDMPAEDYYE